MKLHTGERVRLKPFQDDDVNDSEQFGVVQGWEDEDPTSNDTVIVQLDDLYYNGLLEDGLREVPLDQVEKLED